MDWSFVTGLISGGVLLQVAKSAGGFVFKHWSDRKQAQSKLILADVEKLATLVDPLFKLATTYYGAPSSTGLQTARSIRMDMRTFAMQWNAVNGQLMQLGKPALDGGLLISFRQALTSHLDIERDDALAVDDARVGAMFSATQAVREALSGMRYKL
ncbi:hypothetical protein AB4142_19380 [Variovorax sp. 2RAF20]